MGLVKKTCKQPHYLEFEDAKDIHEVFLNNEVFGDGKDESGHGKGYRQLNIRQKIALQWKTVPRHAQRYRMWSSQHRFNTLTALTDEGVLIPHTRQIMIAKAGFYYSGSANTLVCFHCGCHAHNWSVDDDPMERHAELQPNCPLVRRNVNVKIENGRIATRPRRRHFSENDTFSSPSSYSQ